MKDKQNRTKYMSALTSKEKLSLLLFVPFLVTFIVVFQIIVIPVFWLIDLLKRFAKLMSKEVLVIEFKK